MKIDQTVHFLSGEAIHRSISSTMIEGKQSYRLSELYIYILSKCEVELVTFSRVFLTFCTQHPPIHWSWHVTAPCAVWRQTLSASWQKQRLVRRICMREVIIHTSTCSTSPWKQASPHGGRILSLSLCFLFSSEASGFGKWEMSNEEFHSKKRYSKTEPPTLWIWFIAIQNTDAKFKPHRSL